MYRISLLLLQAQTGIILDTYCSVAWQSLPFAAFRVFGAESISVFKSVLENYAQQCHTVDNFQRQNLPFHRNRMRKNSIPFSKYSPKIRSRYNLRIFYGVSMSLWAHLSLYLFDISYCRLFLLFLHIAYLSALLSCTIVLFFSSMRAYNVHLVLFFPLSSYFWNVPLIICICP